MVLCAAGCAAMGGACIAKTSRANCRRKAPRFPAGRVALGCAARMASRYTNSSRARGSPACLCSFGLPPGAGWLARNPATLTLRRRRNQSNQRRSQRGIWGGENLRTKRSEIDINYIEPRHHAVHDRLTNWGRWAEERPAYKTCPMFRMARTNSRQWHPVTAERPSIDVLDAVVLEKVVVSLPVPHKR